MLEEDAAPPDRDLQLAALNSVVLGAGSGGTAKLPETASLTLVVPLYNERHRFGRFADALTAFIAAQAPGSTLLFVDDGSDDGTADLGDAFAASQPDGRVHLVRCPHRGKGAAVQAGLEAATTALAAFCDLDLSTPPRDLARIIEAARRAPIVAIGSRDVAMSTITRHQGVTRELLGRAYNRAVQLAVAPGILDTQCGAKAARTELWQQVLPWCSEHGFAWDVEVVGVAQQLGIPVQEIPIEWHHDDGSRVHVLRDGIKMLRALPRIRANMRSADLARTSTQEDVSATSTGVFDEDNASVLAAADGAHWWFRSKAAFVSWVLRRWRPSPGWLVDLGAGSGGVTVQLGWPPEQTLIVDGSDHLVSEAKRRYSLDVIRANLLSLPLPDASASVVCLLDVIEHLEEPRVALAEARRALGPDGLLVVNVPGHPGLWSASDEALAHRRRYTAAALRAEIEGAGFEVMFLSHVFSWLVLPLWATRSRRVANPRLGLDMKSPTMDRTALFLTRVEQAIVSRVPLPVGTSVLCVAKPRR
jgi:dolichyl-phosphate beta-glucosyltransferase